MMVRKMEKKISCQIYVEIRLDFFSVNRTTLLFSYNYWTSWQYYTKGVRFQFDKRLLDTFQETIAAVEK